MQMSPKTVNYGGKNPGFGDGRFLQKNQVSVSVSDTVTTLVKYGFCYTIIRNKKTVASKCTVIKKSYSQNDISL